MDSLDQLKKEARKIMLPSLPIFSQPPDEANKAMMAQSKISCHALPVGIIEADREKKIYFNRVKP